MEVSSKDWKQDFAEFANVLCFAQMRPRSMDRTDFALLYIRDEIPFSYMSCHEMDAETVYIQFGGALKRDEKRPWAMNAYMQMLAYLSMKYKRATTSIENTNHEMLRPAMKAGFLIVGTRTHRGKVYVEHTLEFGGKNG